jgi:TM2 domain-containing membrane protein YozV
VGQGILYLLFSWTFIPVVVGFIEGIIYLTMSDQGFEDKYG